MFRLRSYLITIAFSIASSLLLAPWARAQVVAYEGFVLPDADSVPWTRTGTFDCQRWTNGGNFNQLLALGVWPGPRGQSDGYKRSVAEFTGAPTFFVTWRETTNAPRPEINFTPNGISVWSWTGHDVFQFIVTSDRVEFVRDNPIGLVMYLDIAPNVSHTYYLALRNADLSYTWYIDGVVVNSGYYPSAFPNANALVQWYAQYYSAEQTAKWDYVRYGVIPADHSGDFDSNGVVDANDLYFFVDCLLGPDYDAAGPGCRWADMNGDGKADGADIQFFCRAMLPG